MGLGIYRRNVTFIPMICVLVQAQPAASRAETSTMAEGRRTECEIIVGRARVYENNGSHGDHSPLCLLKATRRGP